MSSFVRTCSALLLAALILPSTQLACAQSTTDTPTVLEDPALVQRYQQTITPEDLAAHLYFFASDLFEGRETTTRGQKLAAYYLAAQYRKMGLEPKGTASPEDRLAPEAYFQPFTVYTHRVREARLDVRIDGETVATSTFSPERQEGQAYLSSGNIPEVSGGVVFAGYGIADPALGYDDYAALRAAGVETTGQWLLILRDEPLKDAHTSLLKTDDGAPSVWSGSVSQKIRAAWRSGFTPAGYLIVGDVGPRGEAIHEAAAVAAERIRTHVGSLSLTPEPTRARPPVYVISRELADRILAPAGKTIDALRQEIDRALTPIVFAVPGSVSVQSRIEAGATPLETENVLAFIEGSDPVLKEEVVVLSSHYDHVGIDPTREGDQIFNGADDDGSGTVAVLEMAEAFQRAREDGHGPRRSVLFLNVSGEEKGLLGSEYYADVEPVLPLASTVTNLNIDMIGRYDPTHPTNSRNYVYIIGSNLISQELHDLNAQVNTLTGVNLELDERFNAKDDPNQFYARSDHWNFGKHGIPFIFYFTGTHEDYHQPGDEAHKIDYERMARIARLIFGTAWQVANQDERPAVTGTGFN